MKIGMGNKQGKIYSSFIGICLIVFSIIFSSNVAYADTTKTNEVIVNIEVSGDDNGQVKSGAEIEILYKLSNLKNLYAASVELTYDNSLIKVNSIEPCITGSVYEAYRDTAKDGNKARYAFTFLGSDEMGISGKTDFVKIKASVLKDGNLDIKGEKSLYQMVSKVNNSMEEVKAIYQNSQGETVKIETVEAEKKETSLNNSSNTNNNEQNTNSTSNGSNEKKVTVIGTNNSNKAVSEDEENNDEVKAESLENENTSDKAEDNENNSSLEDEAKDSNYNKQEDEEKKSTVENDGDSNKIIVICSIILVVVAMGALFIYTKKKKDA